MEQIINPESQQFDVFRMFKYQWALTTAGTPEDCSTMTIGWGSLGTIWGPPNRGRSIVTIYVRESRYTLEYLRKNERFTVSLFPEEYRKALGVLGSLSGRDNPDKIAKAGLTPEVLGGSTGFAEANQQFLCRKLFMQKIDPENLSEDIRPMYRDGDLHWMIIGEIEQYQDRR